MLFLLLLFGKCSSLSNFDIFWSPNVTNISHSWPSRLAGSVQAATIAVSLQAGEIIGDEKWNVVTPVVIQVPKYQIGFNALDHPTLFSGLGPLNMWGAGISTKFDKRHHTLVVEQMGLPAVHGPQTIFFQLSNVHLPSNCEILGSWNVKIGSLNVSGVPQHAMRSGCNVPPTILSSNSTTNFTEDQPGLLLPGGNPIMVNDTNSFLLPLRVQLSADRGALTLSSTPSGVHVTVGVKFILDGHYQAINQALANLRYTPQPHFVGPVNVKIDLMDRDQRGPGPMRNTSRILRLFVNSVEDAPVTATRKLHVVDWNSQVVLNVSVMDNDFNSTNEKVFVTLRAMNGNISFGASAVFHQGENKTFGSHFSFSSTLHEAQKALGKIVFRPTISVLCFEEKNGSVTVIVNDTRLQSSTMIPVKIVAVGAFDTCPSNASIWDEYLLPSETILNSKVTYRIHGLRGSHYSSGLQIAFTNASDCSLQQWILGGGAVNASSGKSVGEYFVAVSLSQVGYFHVCYRRQPTTSLGNDAVWMTMKTMVTVSPASNCSSPSNQFCGVPFHGFSSCRQVLAHHTAACGCFFQDRRPGNSLGDINVQEEFPVAAMMLSKTAITMNAGCCVRNTVQRHTFNTTDANHIWGLCARVIMQI